MDQEQWPVRLVNLRTVRLQRRVSQRQLAGQLGWPQSYVSLLERGVVPRHPVDVTRLAEALRVAPGILSGPPLIVLEEVGA